MPRAFLASPGRDNHQEPPRVLNHGIDACALSSLWALVGFMADALGGSALAQSRRARMVNLSGSRTTVVTSTLTQVMDDIQSLVTRSPRSPGLGIRASGS